ncbi:MAG: LacI family DNA-binding transcriptional regulator [Bacteroidales bacterium]|nr:LacI family DNA-binding transcriptional regulator [Bacteroidales bacterium]
MSKRVSLADIAASLGISKTVVSLVVNDKGNANGISKETQQKVRDKIEELNYRPNALARGFRTGKTETIGLIVSDISNRFYSRIARQIEDLAWQHGYSVVICSTDEMVEKERKQVRLLLDRKVDGLIVSSSFTDPAYYNEMVEEGIPHVLIDRLLPDMKSKSVSVDNFGGAQLATRHLINQGMRDIMLFATSPEHLSSINDRVSGFKSAIYAAGINLPEENIIRIPLGKIEETIRDTLQKLYQLGKMPEAIFTLNNISTSVVIKYLSKLSIDIPSETALIGFDETVFFSYTKPSISAIVQPIELISETAFRILINQIEKREQDEKQHIILPIDIVIRDSSVKKAIQH